MDTKRIVMPMYSMNQDFPRECLENGEGIYIKDINGKRYLDAISGIWNVPFGYNNKTINNAIIEQLNKISFANLYVAPAKITYDYADKLIGLLNNDFERMVYTCSGSESIELAVKISRKYQKLIGSQRHTIASFNYSYHGTTYAAMSLSGIDKELANDYKPLVQGVEWINIEVSQNEEDRCDYIAGFIDEYHNVLAGIIVEPIIGSGGVIEIGERTLEVIRKKCDEYNIVLIFDEVATGFGRTGKMFAYQHYNKVPDIMCISKAMSNGMLPIGGVLLGSNVNRLYSEKNSFIEHFSTQNGNPLACAASMAVLDFMEDKLFKEIEDKGRYLEQGLLEKLNFDNSRILIRRKGLMIAIDMKTKSGESFAEELLNNILQTLYKRGVVVHPFYNPDKNSGIMLFPAFISTYEELKVIVEKVCKVLNKVI